MKLRAPSLFTVLLCAPLVSACAGKQAAPETRDAPRTLAPLNGDLASADPAAFDAACTQHLATVRARIAELKAVPRPVAKRDVPRVLEIYDEANAALDTIGATADVVFNAHPDAASRQAGERCTVQAAALGSEIALDRGVYDVVAALDLSGEDEGTRYWIAQDLADFKRAGVNRDDATRAKVKALRDEITQLGNKFESNVNEDATKVQLAPSALAGLPADYIAKHPAGADGKVTLTVQYPDYYPFMKFARSEPARKQMFLAFSNRAHPQNLEVLSQILGKRHELAQLLGYESWAAYSMENKMIRTPKAAHAFIDRDRARVGRARRRGLQAAARAPEEGRAARDVGAGVGRVVPEGARARRAVRLRRAVGAPRTSSSRACGRACSTSPAQMFGMQYQQRRRRPAWHHDVDVYDVFDDGKRLGRIYLDLHPREGKFKHAAQFDLVTRHRGPRSCPRACWSATSRSAGCMAAPATS